MSKTRAFVSRAGLGALATLGLLFILNGLQSFENCQSLRGVHTGEIAPVFSLPEISPEGRGMSEVSLKDFQRKIVVIDFWAVWCKPCRSSLPVLEEVAKKYQDQEVVVLSINIEGKGGMGKARQMADSLAPSVRLLSDAGRVSELYKVTTIPHMLLVNSEGEVVWIHRGFNTAKALKHELTKAIELLL